MKTKIIDYKPRILNKNVLHNSEKEMIGSRVSSRGVKKLSFVGGKKIRTSNMEQSCSKQVNPGVIKLKAAHVSRNVLHAQHFLCGSTSYENPSCLRESSGQKCLGHPTYEQACAGVNKTKNVCLSVNKPEVTDISVPEKTLLSINQPEVTRLSVLENTILSVNQPQVKRISLPETTFLTVPENESSSDGTFGNNTHHAEKSGSTSSRAKIEVRRAQRSCGVVNPPEATCTYRVEQLGSVTYTSNMSVLEHLYYEQKQLAHAPKSCVKVVCDGGYLYVHKVVLAAWSSYLKNMLAEDTSSCPMIILPDFKVGRVAKFFVFMYTGYTIVNNCEELNDAQALSRLLDFPNHIVLTSWQEVDDDKQLLYEEVQKTDVGLHTIGLETSNSTSYNIISGASQLETSEDVLSEKTQAYSNKRQKKGTWKSTFIDEIEESSVEPNVTSATLKLTSFGITAEAAHSDTRMETLSSSDANVVAGNTEIPTDVLSSKMSGYSNKKQFRAARKKGTPSGVDKAPSAQSVSVFEPLKSAPISTTVMPSEPEIPKYVPSGEIQAYSNRQDKGARKINSIQEIEIAPVEPNVTSTVNLISSNTTAGVGQSETCTDVLSSKMSAYSGKRQFKAARKIGTINEVDKAPSTQSVGVFRPRKSAPNSTTVMSSVPEIPKYVPSGKIQTSNNRQDKGARNINSIEEIGIIPVEPTGTLSIISFNTTAGVGQSETCTDALSSKMSAYSGKRQFKAARKIGTINGVDKAPPTESVGMLGPRKSAPTSTTVMSSEPESLKYVTSGKKQAYSNSQDKGEQKINSIQEIEIAPVEPNMTSETLNLISFNTTAAVGQSETCTDILSSKMSAYSGKREFKAARKITTTADVDNTSSGQSTVTSKTQKLTSTGTTIIVNQSESAVDMLSSKMAGYSKKQFKAARKLAPGVASPNVTVQTSTQSTSINFNEGTTSALGKGSAIEILPHQGTENVGNSSSGKGLTQVAELHESGKGPVVGVVHPAHHDFDVPRTKVGEPPAKKKKIPQKDQDSKHESVHSAKHPEIVSHAGVTVIPNRNDKNESTITKKTYNGLGNRDSLSCDDDSDDDYVCSNSEEDDEPEESSTNDESSDLESSDSESFKITRRGARRSITRTTETKNRGPETRRKSRITENEKGNCNSRVVTALRGSSRCAESSDEESTKGENRQTKLSCYFCGDIFESEKGLSDHLSINCGKHLKDSYTFKPERKCQICQKIYPTIISYSEMIKEIHECFLLHKERKNTDNEKGGAILQNNNSIETARNLNFTDKSILAVPLIANVDTSIANTSEHFERNQASRMIVSSNPQDSLTKYEENNAIDLDETLEILNLTIAVDTFPLTKYRKKVKTVSEILSPESIMRRSGPASMTGRSKLGATETSYLVSSEDGVVGRTSKHLKALLSCPYCNKTFNRPNEATKCILAHGFQRCWICLELVQKEVPVNKLTYPNYKQHCIDRKHGLLGDENLAYCPVCSSRIAITGMCKHITLCHLNENKTPQPASLEQQFVLIQAAARDFVKEGVYSDAMEDNSKRVTRKRTQASQMNEEPRVEPQCTSYQKRRLSSRRQDLLKQKEEKGRIVVEQATATLGEVEKERSASAARNAATATRNESVPKLKKKVRFNSRIRIRKIPKRKPTVTSSVTPSNANCPASPTSSNSKESLTGSVPNREDKQTPEHLTSDMTEDKNPSSISTTETNTAGTSEVNTEAHLHAPTKDRYKDLAIRIHNEYLKPNKAPALRSGVPIGSHFVSSSSPESSINLPDVESNQNMNQSLVDLGAHGADPHSITLRPSVLTATVQGSSHFSPPGPSLSVSSQSTGISMSTMVDQHSAIRIGSKQLKPFTPIGPHFVFSSPSESFIRLPSVESHQQQHQPLVGLEVQGERVPAIKLRPSVLVAAAKQSSQFSLPGPSLSVSSQSTGLRFSGRQVQNSAIVYRSHQPIAPIRPSFVSSSSSQSFFKPPDVGNHQHQYQTKANLGVQGAGARGVTLRSGVFVAAAPESSQFSNPGPSLSVISNSTGLSMSTMQHRPDTNVRFLRPSGLNISSSGAQLPVSHASPWGTSSSQRLSGCDGLNLLQSQCSRQVMISQASLNLERFYLDPLQQAQQQTRLKRLQKQTDGSPQQVTPSTFLQKLQLVPAQQQQRQSVPTYQQQRQPVPTYRQQRQPVPIYQQQRQPVPTYQQQRQPVPTYQQQRQPVPTYQQQRQPVPTYEQQRQPVPPYRQQIQLLPAYKQLGEPVAVYQQMVRQQQPGQYTSLNSSAHELRENATIIPTQGNMNRHVFGSVQSLQGNYGELMLFTGHTDLGRQSLAKEYEQYELNKQGCRSSGNDTRAVSRVQHHDIQLNHEETNVFREPIVTSALVNRPEVSVSVIADPSNASPSVKNVFGSFSMPSDPDNGPGTSSSVVNVQETNLLHMAVPIGHSETVVPVIADQSEVSPTVDAGFVIPSKPSGPDNSAETGSSVVNLGETNLLEMAVRIGQSEIVVPVIADPTDASLTIEDDFTIVSELSGPDNGAETGSSDVNLVETNLSQIAVQIGQSEIVVPVITDPSEVPLTKEAGSEGVPDPLLALNQIVQENSKKQLSKENQEIIDDSRASVDLDSQIPDTIEIPVNPIVITKSEESTSDDSFSIIFEKITKRSPSSTSRQETQSSSSGRIKLEVPEIFNLCYIGISRLCKDCGNSFEDEDLFDCHICSTDETL